MTPREFHDEVVCLVDEAREVDLDERAIINALRSAANDLEHTVEVWDHL